MNRKLRVLLAGCVVFAAGATVPRQRISAQNPNSPRPSPTIPKTWDDAAMATLELPLADPTGFAEAGVRGLLLQNSRSAHLQAIPRLRARPRAARLPGLAEAAGTADRLG